MKSYIVFGLLVVGLSVFFGLVFWGARYILSRVRTESMKVCGWIVFGLLLVLLVQGVMYMGYPSKNERIIMVLVSMFLGFFLLLGMITEVITCIKYKESPKMEGLLEGLLVIIVPMKCILRLFWDVGNGFVGIFKTEKWDPTKPLVRIPRRDNNLFSALVSHPEISFLARRGKSGTLKPGTPEYEKALNMEKEDAKRIELLLRDNH